MIDKRSIATDGYRTGNTAKKLFAIAVSGYISIATIQPPTGGGGGDYSGYNNHAQSEFYHKDKKDTDKDYLYLIKEDNEIIEIVQTALKYIL